MEYTPSFRDRLYADIKPSFMHSFRDEHDAKMMYGLPKVKKFPMPDAKHVRSAIRFFNYAKPSEERELASAIIARMHDYGIDPDDINVGDDNRFKKYLQHSYLAHHGIKGMRWGIRRYQNSDGSLTDAGQKRYNKLADRGDKLRAKGKNNSIFTYNQLAINASKQRESEKEYRKKNRRLYLNNKKNLIEKLKKIEKTHLKKYMEKMQNLII